MKEKENALFDALLRANPFFDENAALLTGADLTAARKRLDDAITSFSANAVDQNVGDRAAKGERLRGERMESIGLVARKNLRWTGL